MVRAVAGLERERLARMPRAPPSSRPRRARPCRACAGRSRRAAPTAVALRAHASASAVWPACEPRAARGSPSRAARPARPPAHQLAPARRIAVLHHEQRLAQHEPRRGRVAQAALHRLVRLLWLARLVERVGVHAPRIAVAGGRPRSRAATASSRRASSPARRACAARPRTRSP